MYDRSEQFIAPDLQYVGTAGAPNGRWHGIWVFVDIDPARVTSKSVAIQFDLLESLLQQVDASAKKRGMTRSAVLTLALVDELKKLEV